MAENTSNTSSSSAKTPTFPLITSSSMTVQNLGPVIPIRLTETNYLWWKSLFLPVLRKYRMLSIVDGSEQCPPEFTVDGDGNKMRTEAFIDWFERDQQLLIWINSTLSEAVVPYVVGTTTSRDLWINLEKQCSDSSYSHIIQLKSRLQSVTKGLMPMTQYLQTIKQVADSLTAVGSPIEDQELVAHILRGLPEDDYAAFTTLLRIRMSLIPVTFDEVHGLLLAEEIVVEERHQAYLVPDNPGVFAIPGGRGRGRGGGRGRGRGGVGSGGSFHPPQVVTCQICEKPAHTALYCYNRMNEYQGQIPPPELAAMFASPFVPPLTPAIYQALTAPTANATWLAEDTEASNE